MCVAKQQRCFVEWVIVLCWITSAIMLIYTLSVWNATYPPYAFVILICQLVFFARAIVNMSVINCAIDELGYDNKFYRKLVLPKMMRKFCLGYETVQGVYIIVFVIQCINCINLVICAVYAGLYIYGVKYVHFFPWESYNQCGNYLFLFLGSFYAIVGIYFIHLVSKIENKQQKNKRRLRPFIALKAKHLQVERQWKLVLAKDLEKCCHKYSQQKYIFEKDIAGIEKRILSCYERLIEYDVETNDKGKRILVIRSKSNGENVIEIPLR